MNPTLYCFRSLPENLDQTPELASSLQSLETAFLLIGFKRYPHALVSCVTAIESAIRSRMALPADDGTKLHELLNLIQNHPYNIKALSQKHLDELREMRNRIVHRGFSPEDDDVSVRLFIQTALPLLNVCYQQFFSFYLDWRDVRRGATSFNDLSLEELAKVGLLCEYADSLNLVRRIFAKVRDVRGTDRSYCIDPFVHLIRYKFKPTFIGEAEETLLFDCGAEAYEAEKSAKDIRKKQFFDSSGSECFEFDCPVCDGIETVVAQINDAKLDRKEVSFRQAICVRCGLVLDDKPFITDMVLSEGIAEKQSSILKGYGLAD
jgi:hypothetical protein